MFPKGRALRSLGLVRVVRSYVRTDGGEDADVARVKTDRLERARSYSVGQLDLEEAVQESWVLLNKQPAIVKSMENFPERACY